jgi:hypothetical protein
MRVIAFMRLVGGHVVFLEVMDGLTWCKVSCEVRVESIAYVQLNPAEHQDYLWVTKEEFERHEREREGKVVKFKITEPWHEATMLEEEGKRSERLVCYFVGWVMNIFNPGYARNLRLWKFICALI